MWFGPPVWQQEGLWSEVTWGVWRGLRPQLEPWRKGSRQAMHARAPPLSNLAPVQLPALAHPRASQHHIAAADFNNLPNFIGPRGDDHSHALARQFS